MQERRKDRSDSRPEAAARQLETVAQSGEIELLVVSGDDGSLVARGGRTGAEEAQALAAFGGRALRLRQELVEGLHITDAHTLRIVRAGDAEIACRFFHYRESPLVAVARSHRGAIDQGLLDRAASGVTRILEARDIRRREPAATEPI